MPGKVDWKDPQVKDRLLAAILAGHNVKLNYKDIATFLGGGTTESAVEHIFRPLKKLAGLQERAVRHGYDPFELPVEPKEIHKLFGESTPDGIEFQLRGIKKIGAAQKATQASGGDVAKVLTNGSITPRAKKPKATPTPGSGANSNPSKKRKLPDVTSDAESQETDLSAQEFNTPTKKVKTVNPITPMKHEMEVFIGYDEGDDFEPEGTA